MRWLRILPLAGGVDALLPETLAKYIEAMVIEKYLGKGRLRQYLQTDNELYFSLRNFSNQKELPLNKTRHQPYVYYQKGGLAMYALKDRLGEDRLSRTVPSLEQAGQLPLRRNQLITAINGTMR